MRVFSLLWLATSAAGCGLALDFDPPDPRPPDAGSFDADRADSGTDLDAGDLDAGDLDAGDLDAAALDAADLDASMPDPCVRTGDGVACGPDDVHLICLHGECVVSVCGDLFVDIETFEECDEPDTVSGDGCEPDTCVFSCTGDLDCDDANPCTGIETCDLAAHTCAAGTPPPGLTCAPTGGAIGSCEGGVCVPLACGNGMVEPPEECDDSNPIRNDGCEPDCTLTCTSGDDCSDGNACTGVEMCVAGGSGLSHCEPAAIVGVCDRPDACHVAGCDPSTGCTALFVDADGDGQAPRELGVCGHDCDDGSPAIFLGAPEVCGNGRDDDCDGAIDEAAAPTSCLADGDGDGYGTLFVTSACMCPPGTTTLAGDCYDAATDPLARQVHPGQTMFFPFDYCPTAGTCNYDYDCDGSATLLWTDTFDGRCRDGLLGACNGDGWEFGAVPSCGTTATWVDCQRGVLTCRVSRSMRTQACR